MNAARRRKRPALQVFGFFAISVVGIVMGTVANAHHMNALSELAAGIVGITLVIAVGPIVKAYQTQVRLPVQTGPLIAMSQAMDAGQAVSGKFKPGCARSCQECRACAGNKAG